MADPYQVIARRWRPKNFTELVGQEHIVQTLKNAIEQNRIAHAYLFVGPRGTGKTSTARLFACALNAEGEPSIHPNTESDLAKSIMSGQSMDVIEIDGASNNSVDQIRDLRDDCKYAPTQCRYKIYIIDEVHMLSNAAFNALLKTLEEPPPHVKFFFATTEAHKVLPTIVSRCQRFEFRPIEDSVIVARLKHIAEVDGIQISDEALDSIAKLASGGMRDAQSILDQMIAFCGTQISEHDITDVYGLAPHEQLVKLADQIEAQDERALLSEIDQLVQEGRDLYRILLDLEKVFRSRMQTLLSQKGSPKGGYDIQAYVRVIDTLKSGEDAVKKGLTDRVNFEITLLKAIRELKSVSIDEVIRRIASIRDNLPEVSVKKKA
ncbi:MAG: DNA polymerase III subunit gamma/tau [Puniceicoccaceae bacterium]